MNAFYALFFLVVALGLLQLITLGEVRRLRDALALKKPKPGAAQTQEGPTITILADTSQAQESLKMAMDLAEKANVSLTGAAGAADSATMAMWRLGHAVKLTSEGLGTMRKSFADADAEAAEPQASVPAADDSARPAPTPPDPLPDDQPFKRV